MDVPVLKNDRLFKAVILSTGTSYPHIGHAVGNADIEQSALSVNFLSRECHASATAWTMPPASASPAEGCTDCTFF